MEHLLTLTVWMIKLIIFTTICNILNLVLAGTRLVWLIQNNQMTREKAVKMANLYDHKFLIQILMKF